MSLKQNPDPVPQLSLTIHSSQPLRYSEASSHQGQILFEGASAQFIFELAAKDGGLIGDTLVDALRVYQWYMDTTDHSQILIRSYDRPPLSQKGAERLGLKAVGLRFP